MSGHAAYIFAAYAIAAGVVGAMIATIVADHRALTRALAKLPARDTPDDSA